MVYGTFVSGTGSGRNWFPVREIAAGALFVAACVVVATVGFSAKQLATGTSVLEQRPWPGQSQARMQELSQTSFRTDLVHPYGSMYPAQSKFYNPSGAPRQAVNPEPKYPYHDGHKPHIVLNEDFEHEPYGNHLPWENGPEGALAKFEKRSDKMKSFRYMVNRYGVVNRWDTPLDVSEVDPKFIGTETLSHMSPMPEPEPSAQEVAKALLKMQRNSIQESFRAILPKGAFHDSIIDGESGKQLHVPGSAYGSRSVSCPDGLLRCPDQSCMASMSYCPGCDVVPMPEFCTANAATPSGWRPSMIGCENTTDVGNCGMKNGQGLFLPGEAVTNGVIEGGLA